MDDLDEVTRLVDSSNYTTAVLDAALVHLSLDAFPDSTSTYPPPCFYIERAQVAIGIVALSIQYCQRSKAMKKAAISQILGDVDGILTWTGMIAIRISEKGMELQRQKQQQRLVDFVQGLCSLDPILELAILSSRRGVELLVTIWSVEPVHSCEEQSIHTIIALPSLELMESFTDNSDGCELIYDTMRSSPWLVEQLHQGIEARLSDISTLYRKGLTVAGAMHCLGVLGMVIVHLTQEPAMDALFREGGLSMLPGYSAVSQTWTLPEGILPAFLCRAPSRCPSWKSFTGLRNRKDR
jgi:hypothetical protein